MPLSREQFMELRRQGLSPEQIAGFEAGNVPAGPSPNTTASSMAQTYAGQGRRQMQDLLRGLMPAAGAMGAAPMGARLGALAGAPFGPVGAGVGAAVGGVGGAFLGGAGGEGVREATTGVAPDPRAMVGEGGKQAVFEALGLPAAPIMQMLSRSMMKAALAPPKAMAKEAVVKNRPGVVREVLAQGGTVGTIAGRGGFREAEKVRAARGRATRQEYKRLGRTGFTVDPKSVVPSVDDLVPKGTPIKGEARQKAQELIEKFLADNPGPLGVGDLKPMKQQAWEEANPIFAQIRKGEQPVTNEQRIWANFHHALGKKINEAIRTSGRQGRRVVRAERQTQSAINSAQAIADAEARMSSGASHLMPTSVGRGSAMLGGGVVGYQSGEDRGEQIRNALIGALVGSTSMHPTVLSRAVYAPGSPFLQWLMGQSPRAIGTMAFPPDSLTPP